MTAVALIKAVDDALYRQTMAETASSAPPSEQP